MKTVVLRSLLATHGKLDVNPSQHAVPGMSDIVVELSRRNWSDVKIARELGMDTDEVSV